MSLYRLAFGRSVSMSSISWRRREIGPVSLLKNAIKIATRKHSKQAASIEQQMAENSKMPMNKGYLVRPFLFTIASSGVFFAGTTIWEYEYVRSEVKKMMSTNIPFYGKKSKNLSDLDGFWKRLHNGQISEAWKRLSFGDQFFLSVCALNVLVFALWRIPRLQATLLKNFASNPAGLAPCRSMLLSTFSHYSFFHIFANMYVLHSFSNAICMSLGKEQTWAVYLSAGVVSSFASYIHKVFVGVSGVSLGASGAILGIVGYICTRYPETRLQIMFLPMFNFSAENAIIAIMAIDVLGIAFGWKFFDHAAHLGGALFGVFWCHYGEKYIWPKRKYITEKWHHLRSIAMK